MAFLDSNTRTGEKLWGTCVSTQAFGITQRVDRGNTKSTGQQRCEALQFMAQYCIVLSTHFRAENSSLPMSFLTLEGLQILVISSGIGRPCKIPPLSASLPYTLTRSDYSRRMHQGTVQSKWSSPFPGDSQVLFVCVLEEVLSALHDVALAVLQLSKEYALEVFSVEEVDGSEEDTLYFPVFPHKLLKVLENG